MVALARLGPGARILEVGSGTGQATRLFAARGLAVTAVEAGPALAAATRANVPAAEVIVGRFEEAPLPSGAFALVLSATAWHWIDAARGYARAREVLVPGGALALFWNEHVRGDDDVGFFAATQDLYERAGMSRHRLQPSAEPRDRTAEIVASGDFGEVARRHHPWSAEYDARATRASSAPTPITCASPPTCARACSTASPRSSTRAFPAAFASTTWPTSTSRVL